MPSWAFSAALLAYIAFVILLGCAAAFSRRTYRRNAALRVLNVVLPWALLAMLIQLLIDAKTRQLPDPAMASLVARSGRDVEEPPSE